MTINTYTPPTDPLSWSFGHGTACKAPASSPHPRTASDHLDGVLYDQLPSPAYISLLPYTLHIADESAGTVYWLSAIGCHNHDLLRTGSPRIATIYVHHSTLSQPESVPHSQDAYMVYWVSTA